MQIVGQLVRFLKYHLQGEDIPGRPVKFFYIKPRAANTSSGSEGLWAKVWRSGGSDGIDGIDGFNEFPAIANSH